MQKDENSKWNAPAMHIDGSWTKQCLHSEANSSSSIGESWSVLTSVEVRRISGWTRLSCEPSQAHRQLFTRGSFDRLFQAKETERRGPVTESGLRESETTRNFSRLAGHDTRCTTELSLSVKSALIRRIVKLSWPHSCHVSFQRTNRQLGEDRHESIVSVTHALPSASTFTIRDWAWIRGVQGPDHG